MPKYAVLDLDETLVSTRRPDNVHNPYGLFSNQSIHDLVFNAPEPLYYSITTDRDAFWGLVRPGLQTFLGQLPSIFDHVIVWSAGTREYVDAVCSRLFTLPGVRPPALILARENCAQTGGQYHKPLAQLRRWYPDLSLQQTVIVDDRLHTFQANPGNGILIPAYAPVDPVNWTDRSDTALHDLAAWFQSSQFQRCTDVTRLDQSGIFTRSASPQSPV